MGEEVVDKFLQLQICQPRLVAASGFRESPQLFGNGAWDFRVSEGETFVPGAPTSASHMGVSENRGTLFGVPIIRILLFRLLY